MNKLYQRYVQLSHAIQSGVAFLMHYDKKMADPKHLRTGLDLRAVDHGALVALLIEKKVFTDEEYAVKLIEYAEREVKMQEEELAKYTNGAKVTLQ